MKKFFILISALSVFAACQKEVSRDGTSPVQIRIVTGSTVNGAKTRANNYAEDAVVKVDVLVFKQATTGDPHLDATLVESKYAFKKSSGDNIYNATLKSGTDLDLYFAINAQQIIENADLEIGDKWRDVQTKLIMSPADMINRPEYGLPMWGYRYGETINQNGSGNNFGTVYLSRAVASADVDITATNFTLLEGSVEYVTNKGYLAYLVANGNFRVDDDEEEELDLNKPQMPYWLIKPQIPTEAVTGTGTGTGAVNYRVAYTLNTDPLSTSYDGNKIVSRLYFFENDGPAIEPAPANGRDYTKVILKGIWDDPDVANDTKITFYPLAFRDRDENGELINERVAIIRNRKFQFSISNVNGHGYDKIEDAKQGTDLNMKYEVIPWDIWDDTNIVVGSDSRWISFSPSRNKTEVKQASLYRNKTSTDEISFTTNYDPDDFAMTLSDEGESVTLTAAEEAAGVIAKVRNEFYEITLVSLGTNADGDAIGKFIFTAREDYSSDNVESTLTITNGYVKFLLKVDQENSSLVDWTDGGKQPWRP